MWVTDHDAGIVVRIDRESGEEGERIDIGGRAVSLLETEEGVWAGSGHDAIWSVKLIDPATNDVTRTLERGALPGYGLGSFWFGRNQFDQSGTVRRVDPVSGEDLAEIPLASAKEGCYIGGAYPEAAWGFCFLPNEPTIATRLDLGAGKVAATVPLDGDGGLLGVAGEYSWFDSGGLGVLPYRLLRVDNATNQVDRVYAEPGEVAIVGEVLWMLDREAGELRTVPLGDL